MPSTLQGYGAKPSLNIGDALDFRSYLGDLIGRMQASPASFSANDVRIVTGLKNALGDENIADIKSDLEKAFAAAK